MTLSAPFLHSERQRGLRSSTRRLAGVPLHSVLAVVALLAVRSAPAAGQEPLSAARMYENGRLPDAPPGRAEKADGASSGIDWLPGAFIVAPLRAKPREVRLRAGVIAVDRDLEPDYPGRHGEAQVDLGVRIPVVRFQEEAGARPAMDLGLEVGTYSRFERDFVSIDFRVGFPFSLRAGPSDVRFTVFHESSHIGDEYAVRFGREPREVSREAVELLTGLRPATGWRLYVGGDLNFGRGTDEQMDRWRLRFGGEWDTTAWSDRRWGPYAATDLEIDDVSERVAITAVAGLAVRLKSWRLLADLEVHDGPSPMRQFPAVAESFWGFNLAIEPLCDCGS